ncbi:UvrD-helicase domain-containing protein [Burkholderiaceae bacterium FT117]|uniref:UvrD-helicase domain-containing protein n=1 Tax=Zeimonas sediminis TaxID=2944268 RepID=UPI002342DEE2|nr:UvrD-helicase domain-containing protein [Zeimonas sediminis]MCM5572146.1 UvrD-helicase domain-containing protein [Zeimonas sediminis]
MSTPAALDAHPVFDPGILRGFHLLESDAGTGKTWTIAGLVVRALVEEGLEIDRILVVTFTNAATAELAARIRERIAAMAALLEASIAGAPSPVDELFCREYLARIDDREAALRRLRIAHARIDEAAVRTIHGFCQRVIDEHGLTIGLAGGVEVGEGDDGWIDAMVDDWWRRRVVPADAAGLALLAESGVDPESLARRVRAIHENPDALRAVPAGDWRALSVEMSGLRARLAAALAAEAAPLLDWIGAKGNVSGKFFQSGWTRGWLAKLADWANRPAGVPMTRSARGKFADTVGKLARDRFEQALAGRPMPAYALPDLCSELLGLLPRCDDVAAELAEEVWRDGEPRRLARRTGGERLAFDDLLAIVHDALDAPGSGARLARALRERYPLALIDECQDTDARQWAIFRRIHLDGPGAPGGGSHGGLVLVGDPKQAIYAFRGADVYSYLEARDAGPAGHALRENQRSVPGLVEAVNALFEAGDAFGVPGIEFRAARVGTRRRRALAGGEGGDDRAVAGAPRAPLTVLRLAGGPGGAALSADRAGDLAVAATVAEIGRLLAAGLRLDDAPVAPSDIAVLVDSHRQGSLVKRALGAVGIGAVEVSRERVVDSAQAEELARWLAAVAEPADGGLVRAALLATPAGLDAASLEALPAEPARWNAWVERFSDCRDTWARRGPQAALRGLLFGSGAAARLAGLRDGERRLTNFLHLFELIAASHEAAQGPRQAWRWLMRERGSDARGGEALELRLDSDENLVRILTVHKSKGLEFPFVFLPFAWQGREAKAEAPFVHHPDPAPGPDRAARRRPVLELSDRPADEAVAQRMHEIRAESVRRLYVALTRAEQRCYLLWGPVDAAADAPLAGRLAALGGFAGDPERSGDPVVLSGAVEAWRDAAPGGSVAVVDLAAAGLPFTAEAKAGAAAEEDVAADADAIVAGSRTPASMPVVRGFQGPIPAPWIRTSFSALAQRIADAGGRTDAGTGPVADERPDHDQVDAGGIGAGYEAGIAEPEGGSAESEAGIAESEATPGSGAPGEGREAAEASGQALRFAFPAGARAGSCLHGILEHCEFGAPIDRRLVSAQLGRAGFPLSATEGVAGWLDEVLDTGLRAPGDGRAVSLRGIDSRAAVREMDFLLPGRDVDDRALVEAVAGEYPVDALVAGSRWSGFLRGFIDLVFEQDGRWYVLDWKSNRLGGGFADYGAPALDAAMRDHAYSLQACLYLLVLHRFLRRRLAGYDWDRHVGGAFWVFLRGVRPSPPGGSVPGVHASKPSRALIERLDRLFDGEAR